MSDVKTSTVNPRNSSSGFSGRDLAQVEQRLGRGEGSSPQWNHTKQEDKKNLRHKVMQDPSIIPCKENPTPALVYNDKARIVPICAYGL